MNSKNIELFKELATCDVKNEELKSENLLEGTKYYVNAMKIMVILNDIANNDIGFTIKHGFKGSSFEKSNTFNKVTIKIQNSNDINYLEKLLSKYKSTCKYKLKENNLVNIQVKS